jgi:hypothetical protein
MQESGGQNIPQAIHDVNTDNGTPAFGPMQMIEPTFRAYAVPGHTDWHNPVDEMASAANYIADRYGNPDNLPAGGYSTGGLVGLGGGSVLVPNAANWAGIMDAGGTFAPGLNVAANNTGAAEHLSPVGPIDYDRLADAIVGAITARPLTVSAGAVSHGFEDRRRAYSRS